MPTPIEHGIFLFTDMEGSTRLWEHYPEAMPAALARHDELLRAAINAQRGRTIKTVGDAFYAIFDSVPAALAAALTAQRALQAEDWRDVGTIRVRMALHCGPAQFRDDDYYGPTLNRVHRLLNVAHGGQIILSEVAARSILAAPTPDIALRDLGQHLLKDLIQPEHIYQVVAPDLPADFPPLRTVGTRATNLPVQATPLIGREQEVTAVCALLRAPAIRLLTLTGFGGTGKTRLSLQVAAELLDDFPDGVFFVPLTAITDHTLVTAAIAQTLGVRESAGQALIENVQHYLRDRRLLLVLDNFEQVIEARQVVSDLLTAAPQLKVIVTSREVLHLYGEHEYPVPPLSLPDPQHITLIDLLMRYSAIALFVERARAVKPDFALTPDNATELVRICAALDGLPLAIELAAARVKVLSPVAILTRLNHRLTLLTSGGRDLPARQRTLRGAIDWSYDLLSGDEKILLAQLAIFSGGASLTAIEAIGLGTTDRRLDDLAALVDKSLLRQQTGLDGEPRFVLLETLREYAAEKLATSGLQPALQCAHAHYFMQLAEQAEPELVGAQQVTWLNRLAEEHHNLLAALHASLSASGEATIAIRLAGALWRFWFTRGYPSEGRYWLIRALQAAPDPTAARAKALYGAGGLAYFQGDYAAARSLYEESLQLGRALDDRYRIADALNGLGLLFAEQGTYDVARAHYTEALTLRRQLNDQRGEAIALNNLALVATSLGESVEVDRLYAESLAIFRLVGDNASVARALANRGVLAFERCAYEQAWQIYEECLELRRELGDRRGTAVVLVNLALVATYQQRFVTAHALFRDGLRTLWEMGDRRNVAECLEGLAALAHQEQQAWPAVRLFNAAEALREAIGAPLAPTDRHKYEVPLQALRTQLSAAEFAAAQAAGRSQPIEQLIASIMDREREYA